jgi:hypothetical protein
MLAMMASDGIVVIVTMMVTRKRVLKKKFCNIGRGVG